MKRKEILEGWTDHGDYVRPKRRSVDPDAWKHDRDSRNDLPPMKRYEPSDAEKEAEKEYRREKAKKLAAVMAMQDRMYSQIYGKKKKDVDEGNSPDAELKRYLMKDVNDKVQHLNQMYVKAKQLGDMEVMSKIKTALAKISAKKAKLASELGISEAELDEMDAGAQPKEIEKADATTVTLKSKDPTDQTRLVVPKTQIQTIKDPTGKDSLVVSKGTQQTGPEKSENPIRPGAQVMSAMKESSEVDAIKKLAGL